MKNEQEATAPTCDHYWASVHEPGHVLFWISQCMLCHRIDWDDLDIQIKTALEVDRVPVDAKTVDKAAG